MMLDIQRALNRDRLLRALIGLNCKAFDALLATFTPLYEQARQTQSRQRSLGGGRKAPLLSTLSALLPWYFLFCPIASVTQPLISQD